MMPRPIITFLVIIFCAFAFKAYAGKQKNDLKYARLKGKVRACTVYSHEINDPHFLKVFNSNVKQSISTNFYDRQGYCTKTLNSVTDKNDKVIRYSSLTYDVKGRQPKASTKRKIKYYN